MPTHDAMGARSCPLCDGTARGVAFPHALRWEGQEFRHVRCGDCGATFVDPLPDPALLESVYAWEAYHRPHYAELSDDRHAPALRLLERVRPAGGSLLDFGCGAGAFMVDAAAAGWHSQGVEYAATTIAEVARRTGLPVATLEDVEASGQRFDVIHLSDVLPHVRDPVAICRRLLALLAPGGRLLISGPLESQPGLVHWIARAGKRLRRAVRPGEPPERPPTMLVRTSAQAERRFLQRRLGLQIEHFAVWESGWPYRSRTGGPGGALGVARNVIGLVAIATSRAAGLFGVELGNRYLALAGPG